LFLLTKSDGVLVAGTSLHVFSVFRFIKAAHEKGVPIAIVNRGPTRGDELAELKVEDSLSHCLPKVVEEIKIRRRLSLA